MKNDKETSWGEVANWYDDVVNSSDSYQKHVIMPNILRILNPKKDMVVLDVACGQGYFSRAFTENGVTVIASDISKELIRMAEVQSSNIKNSNISSNNPQYHVASADKLTFANDATVDVAVIILAIQNIENIAGVIAEISRTLKPNGRFIMVINHPTFRIPQKSDWGWDESLSKQYRKVYSYMSDESIKIDMTPGEKDLSKKKFTVSFHRPLQTYFKLFAKNGLSVTRLEEWISHKKSQSGPRSAEEDRLRKEIPMFLCLEVRKS